MSSFICLILGICAIYQVFANNQICLNEVSLTFGEVNLSFGYFLPYSCFRTLYEISLINCAKECLFSQTRCKSFNYITSALSCSLCEDESGPFKRNLIEKPERTHGDIAHWPKDLAGRCKDVVCPPTHRCNPLISEMDLNEGSATLCELSGCGLSPSTNWSTKSTHEEIIGTRVTYSCPNRMTQRGNPIIQCQANGTWTDFNFTCAPRNCKEIRDNVEAITGVYIIYPSSDSAGIPVRCDMTTDGGGWTVFQRRVDGSVDFYRGWEDYKSGFGDLDTEFWLGLDNIHTLTSQGKVELRVDLVTSGPPAKAAYAKYTTFYVSDGSNKYVLNVNNYSGNANDSILYHNGMPFTTKDRDNDRLSENCAILYHGAWWYKSCHASNLNGDYGSTNYGKGLTWKSLSGHNVSMIFTEMKIRDIKS